MALAHLPKKSALYSVLEELRWGHTTPLLNGMEKLLTSFCLFPMALRAGLKGAGGRGWRAGILILLVLCDRERYIDISGPLSSVE